MRGIVGRMKSALLGISLLVLLPGLGYRDHWDSAEARAPLVARDMLETGRWHPPYLAGSPYWNKPPLFHLLVAGSFRILGQESECAARLPAVLAAIAAVLATAAAGRMLGGARAGLWSGLFLLLGARFFLLSRSCELETLLTATTALGLLALVAEAIGRLRSGGAFALAAIAAGLGTWTKGPVVAPLGVLLAATALAIGERRWGRLATGALLGTIAGTLAAALVYYGPPLLDPATRALLLDRATFTNVAHRRGPFYYVYELPVMLAPGILLFLNLRRASREAHPAARHLAAAALAGVALFSLSASKQSHYIVPLFPLLAPLAGACAAAWPRPRQLRTAAAAGLLLLLGFDLLRARAGDADQSPKVALAEFRTTAAGHPVAILDPEPLTVLYMDRPDVVILDNDVHRAREFLSAHPDGFVILEADRPTDVPETLRSVPVARSWRSPSDKDGWILLGPGSGVR